MPPRWITLTHSAMDSKDRYTSLDEVRAEIDAPDRDLVRLLGRRAACVSAARRFKTTEQGVRDPEPRGAGRGPS